MAKRKSTTQKQKQKQSVIVNINTSGTKRRKYVRKPKGQGGNNQPPPPPHQPQMIIHQQTYSPQPLIQNPTPPQMIPQVQPSSFHNSVAESQAQAQAPRSNGIERTPAPPPRQPTPPPTEEQSHPFSVNESRKRENKNNDALLDALYKKRNQAVSVNQSQEQHSIIDYEHEPTVLETRPIKAGIHTFQDMMMAKEQPAKQQKTIPSDPTLKFKGKVGGESRPLTMEEVRQQRSAMFEKPVPDNKIHQYLHPPNEKLNEAEERYNMFKEDTRILPYIQDETGHITPNPRFGLSDLKTPLGTRLDEKPKEVDLDTPLEPEATPFKGKELFSIFNKEPLTEENPKKKVLTMKSQAEELYDPTKKAIENYSLYQNYLKKKGTTKKVLQQEMRLRGLKPFYGDGEKTKSVMVKELEDKYKKEHKIIL